MNLVVDVACDGATHRVRYDDGRLQALDHDEDAERTLRALGARLPDCVHLCEAWTRRAQLDPFCFLGGTQWYRVPPGVGPGVQTTPGWHALNSRLAFAPEQLRALGAWHAAHDRPSALTGLFEEHVLPRVTHWPAQDTRVLLADDVRPSGVIGVVVDDRWMCTLVLSHRWLDHLGSIENAVAGGSIVLSNRIQTTRKRMVSVVRWLDGPEGPRALAADAVVRRGKLDWMPSGTVRAWSRV